jgi:hypothetical protein
LIKNLIFHLSSFSPCFRRFFSPLFPLPERGPGSAVVSKRFQAFFLEAVVCSRARGGALSSSIFLIIIAGRGMYQRAQG